MTAPAGYAETIALDVIAQLTAYNTATPLAVPTFNAAFDRMYVTNLEDMLPAGNPATEFQIVLAPVGDDSDRTAWGAQRITVTLGLLFNVAVEVLDDQVTDPNIAAYEAFVNQVTSWLIGARHFAGVWNASKPKVIWGDHYNDHLFEKSEFHVPALIEFFCDVGTP